MGNVKVVPNIIVESLENDRKTVNSGMKIMPSLFNLSVFQSDFALSGTEKKLVCRDLHYFHAKDVTDLFISDA
jgi:hypothetical protein